MTLTLVTLTITGSLTLTQFSRSSTATATAPLFCSRPPLRFPSGVGWVLNLPCPSATTFTALSRPPQDLRRVPLRLRNASPTPHDHYAVRSR